MELLRICNRTGIIAHRKHNRQHFTPSFSNISKSLFDKIKRLGKICIFSLFYFVSKNILDHHLQLHNKGQRPMTGVKEQKGWGERGGGGLGGGGARNSLSYFNVRPFSLLTPAT